MTLKPNQETVTCTECGRNVPPMYVCDCNQEVEVIVWMKYPFCRSKLIHKKMYILTIKRDNKRFIRIGQWDSHGKVFFDRDKDYVDLHVTHVAKMPKGVG